MMTRGMLSTLAAAGSAALLLGALGFQHLGGYAPCRLCLLQRWPHVAAVILGLAAVGLPPRVLWRFLGLASALAAAGLGFYHAGVERGWWQGPADCAGGAGIGALTPEQLLDRIMAAPVVRCTEVAWQALGLSMAGWNAVLSLGLAALWAGSLMGRRGGAR